MATSKPIVQLDDVRQTVTCGICLQLLTDPRALTCGHTYCLICLKGFQKTATRKECPVCRANTVPATSHLDSLPVSKLALQLVKLVHTYEPSSQEAPPNWTENKNSTPKSKPERRTGLDRYAAMLSLLEGLRTTDDDDDSGDTDTNDDRPRHTSVTCDNCRKNSIRGHRYKCGICDDYDLCETCEAKPRDTIHDVEHLFVKLKSPRTASPALQRVLHDDSTILGMTQDSSQSKHVLRVDDQKCITYRCDKCNASPITGVRYKCGTCPNYDLCEKCEKTSESFHDPKHVFIVIKHPVGFHTTVPQVIYNFYR